MKRQFSRKDFIKKAGITLAGAPLLSYAGFPNIILPTKKEKLGVALVGLGYYSGSLLAPALQLTEHCELKGIVTGSPDKIPIWQNRYGIKDSNVYNYETMSEIANNDEIDIIYIVTPSGLHGVHAIKAANTGKNVWCEKPMETNVQRCQEIIQAAERNKVQLTIGYRMQHEPNTQTVMGFAKEKPYGNITELQSEAGFRANHRQGNWRTIKKMGGGALFDMGVYCINAARYSTGEEPIAVSATKITTRPNIYSEVDETMMFELEFRNGVTAKCSTSFSKGLNSLQVNCENGWYNLRPFQSYNGVNGVTSDGVKLNKPINNQQAQQMDNDALAIKENKPPLVPGEEGLLDVRVCEAIFESADKDGLRIQI
tara:strand:- start:31254 stop:32360 length:1107 start_codon:yes stop_codon:yes gene_type:complete